MDAFMDSSVAMEMEEDACDDYGGASEGMAIDSPAREEAKEAKAAVAASSPQETLQRLVALQEFSGSFQLNASLASVVGKQLGDLEALVAASGVGDVDVAKQLVATAVAIAFARARLADLEDQWELVVAKSLKWLAKEAAKHAKTADDFITAAASLF
jgi:hypothetical protein